MMVTRLFSVTTWLIGTALMLACTAAAQPQSSGALHSFAPFQDGPARITAKTLELRDKIGQATFSGDVRLVLDDGTTLTCKVLVVFYERTQARPDGEIKRAICTP
jgi:lipopolysaccharide export system protein LptA